MALVFHSQGVGKPPLMENTLNKYGPAEVGRWAKWRKSAPPDRCDFCSLADIKPATGFVVEDGWMRGYCAEHKP